MSRKQKSISKILYFTNAHKATENADRLRPFVTFADRHVRKPRWSPSRIIKLIGKSSRIETREQQQQEKNAARFPEEKLSLLPHLSRSSVNIFSTTRWTNKHFSGSRSMLAPMTLLAMANQPAVILPREQLGKA